MRECPRCESCFEDDVLTCPQDEANTKGTLPGPRLLAARYFLEKRLGRGAMGQVYLAKDQNLLTRRVAVKTERCGWRGWICKSRRLRTRQDNQLRSFGGYLRQRTGISGHYRHSGIHGAG